MKVAKCCESKEPELLTFEQIKEREGVYKHVSHPNARFIVLKDANSCAAILYSHGILIPADNGAWGWRGNKFLRTNETPHFGLKDAAGKWVE